MVSQNSPTLFHKRLGISIFHTKIYHAFGFETREPESWKCARNVPPKHVQPLCRRAGDWKERRSNWSMPTQPRQSRSRHIESIKVPTETRSWKKSHSNNYKFLWGCKFCCYFDCVFFWITYIYYDGLCVDAEIRRGIENKPLVH